MEFIQEAFENTSIRTFSVYFHFILCKYPSLNRIFDCCPVQGDLQIVTLNCFKLNKACSSSRRCHCHVLCANLRHYRLKVASSQPNLEKRKWKCCLFWCLTGPYWLACFPPLKERRWFTAKTFVLRWTQYTKTWACVLSTMFFLAGKDKHSLYWIKRNWWWWWRWIMNPKFL